MAQLTLFLLLSTILHAAVFGVVQFSGRHPGSGFRLKNGTGSIDTALIVVPAQALFTEVHEPNVYHERFKGDFLFHKAFVHSDVPIPFKRKSPMGEIRSSGMEEIWEFQPPLMGPIGSAIRKPIDKAAFLIKASMEDGSPASSVLLGINRLPHYPRIALIRGWEGEVMVRLFINHAGRVESVDIVNSSGYRVLDESVLSTVEGWVFPDEKGKVLDVPFQFKMETVAAGSFECDS